MLQEGRDRVRVREGRRRGRFPSLWGAGGDMSGLSDAVCALVEQSVLSSAAVLGSDGDIVVSVDTRGSVPFPESADVTNLFADRDETVGRGITIRGELFDVHRFYEEEGLVYGRRGDAETGEGVCVHRVKRASDGAYNYCVITYKFPTISAKAIPDVQAFGAKHVSVL